MEADGEIETIPSNVTMDSAQAQQQDAVDVSSWVCMYPSYFCKERSLSNGRRVPLESALPSVCAAEVYEATKRVVPPEYVRIENKTYCRDYLNRGRIRVSLKDCSAKAKNRQQLFLAVAKELPFVRSAMEQAQAMAQAQLKPNKKNKGAKDAAAAIESAKDVAAMAAAAAAEEGEESSAAAAAAASSSGGSSSQARGGSSKKGKKGRR
ncbi:signal recognition particle subunit [Pycnococcus provasolii]|uniref:Signal recognition particle subunit n=1 Tax=Pycnococcus provasolii TaxID=41880 RepID=A0A830I150_9CHLO|nr:signal recognition particle subunit [Pycnococcus provasolii]